MSAAVRFFSSRWIQAPPQVEQSGGSLPDGFRAAGVACGIKDSGALDLGLMACASPNTTSAARFTRSGTQSAAVLLRNTRVRARPSPVSNA